MGYRSALTVKSGKQDLKSTQGIYSCTPNAEQGTNYNIEKIMNWVFEGCKNPKWTYQWLGVIVVEMGGYDVSGLQGSITDGGGYAF